MAVTDTYQSAPLISTEEQLACVPCTPASSKSATLYPLGEYTIGVMHEDLGAVRVAVECPEGHKAALAPDQIRTSAYLSRVVERLMYEDATRRA